MIRWNTKILLVIAGMLLGTSGAAYAQDVATTSMPVIILKLDDLTRAGASRNAVSPRWQRLVDFVESRQIKASIGIICSSLEEDNQAYFDWIKAVHQTGRIEFWNHGYKHRVSADDAPEFEGASLEQQKHALGRGQELARTKLGIELHAFGPHYSLTDEQTIAAIKSLPEITVWFFGPKELKDPPPLVLDRGVNLETPTFHPNFEKFRQGFETWGVKRPYVVLQGHPNQWDDQRFAEFTKVIDYLQERGCTFTTPSAYAAATQNVATGEQE